MTDIANLGFRVDSASAVRATSDLDRLGDQATVTERQVTGAARKSTQAFSSMAAPVRGASRGFSSLSQTLRPMSMQLSQVAQQGQVTGNYLQALSIQAADIGMAFGTIGIAAGVAAGFLLPFASNLIGTGNDAEEAEKALEAFTDAISRAKDMAGIAASPIDELRQEFGEFAEEVRRGAQIAAQAALADSMRSFTEASSVIGSELDATSAAAVRYQQALDALQTVQNSLGQRTLSNAAAFDEAQQSVDAARAAMAEAASDIGLTALQAVQLEQALNRVAGSQGMENVARSASDALDEIDAMFSASQNIPPEVADIVAQLQLVLQAAASGTAAFDDMTGAAGRAADEAGRLAANLARAMALQPITPAMQDEDVVMSQPVLSTGATREGQRQAVDNFNRIIAAQNRGGRSSRSSGGRSGGADPRDQEAAKIMREVERATLDAMSATERYNREAQDLKELHEDGYLSANEYQRAMDMIGTELEDAQFENMRRGIESVSDAIAQAIVNGEDLGETFGNVVKQMASDLISSGLRDLIGGLFSGSSGSSGGFFGNLFAGWFDKGGPIPRGQFGIVGERGPEIVTGPAQVTSRAQTARIMGGGQVGGSATLRIIAPEGFSVQQQGQIQNIAIQVASEGISRYDRQTLPGSVERINRDPKRRG